MQWCTTLPRTCHGPFANNSINARRSVAVALVGHRALNSRKWAQAQACIMQCRSLLLTPRCSMLPKTCFFSSKQCCTTRSSLDESRSLRSGLPDTKALDRSDGATQSCGYDFARGRGLADYRARRKYLLICSRGPKNRIRIM